MANMGKLGKNFSLLTIGNFASTLLRFLFVPLYTAVLSTQEYGSIDLVTVTISLSFPILTLVISEAVMRFCLEEGSDGRQIFSIGIYITGAGCLLMLLLSGVLLHTPLRDYYGWFVAYFIVQSFYTTFAQYVKGQEKIEAYAIGGLLNTVIVILCNIVFLLVLKIGINGYFLSMILGHAATIVFYLVATKSWTSLIPVSQLDKGLMTAMLAYSCPMIPNSISWWISDSSDKYILSYFCGVGENGIYAIAYKIPSMLSIITGLFISAWQISAVESFNSEKSDKLFSDIGSKCIALNVLVSAWLIAGSRLVADFLFSGEYYAAWRISPILIVAYVFSALSSFYGTIYTSARKTKMLLYSTIVAALINIGLNILLIPFFGGMGAAVATLISYCVVWGIRVIDSAKIMQMQLPWGKILACFVLLIAEVVMLNQNTWWADVLCLFSAGVVTLLNFDVCRGMLSVVVRKLGAWRRK